MTSGRPIDADVRRLIERLRSAGRSVRETARLAGVSKWAVEKYSQAENTKSPIPKQDTAT